MPDGHCRWPSSRELMGGGETLHHELPISTIRVPEKTRLREKRNRLGGMWPHQDGASCIQVARNAHYPQSVSARHHNE